jgi:hypothetical protein
VGIRLGPDRPPLDDPPVKRGDDVAQERVAGRALVGTGDDVGVLELVRAEVEQLHRLEGIGQEHELVLRRRRTPRLIPGQTSRPTSRLTRPPPRDCSPPPPRPSSA